MSEDLRIQAPSAPGEERAAATPAPRAAPPGAEPQSLPPARRRRPWLRPLLLLLGPLLVVLIGGCFYLSSGRYVGTDNAYVKADLVTISAQVPGQIAAVTVAENEHVAPDQILFRLDRAPFELALRQAEAKLQQARRDLAALQGSYRQKQAELQLARDDARYAERERVRQADLVRKQFVSDAQYDAARHAVDASRQQVVVLEQDLARIEASLGGQPEQPVERQPAYLAAQAARDAAALDLAHAEIKAPFAGIAANTPQPGQYVEPGQPVMSVVADQRVWIEANFKETDLTHVLPGQPVQVTIDTYPGTSWSATVQSISQATQAEFSVLPAQNATGNWVKVVQRIPVRIAIQPQPDAPPLRAGMSSYVAIDTGQEPAGAAMLHRAMAWLGAAPAQADAVP